MNSSQTQPASALENSADELENSPSGAEPCNDVAEEINGPKGPEPTRFGDWERKGRCIDF